VPNTTQCVSDAVQTCNASGVWSAGTPCAQTQTCSGGACVACAANKLDCNGNQTDGCEIDLTNPATCGTTCGNTIACANTNATASTCPSGACVFTCKPGYGDCDGNGKNGCEAQFSVTNTCGKGICASVGTTCAPSSCVPGTPQTEICNNLDDDCNGTIDDGPTATLCPPPSGVATTKCLAGGTCAISQCNASDYDIDGTYSNGCECIDDGWANACTSATWYDTLQTVGQVDNVYGYTPLNGANDWFYVKFPNVASGKPHMILVNSPGYVMDVGPDCTTALSSTCNVWATGLVEWTFSDTYSGNSRSVAWPGVIYVRVYRTASANSCQQYDLQATL
jgi:hypothetical protein